MSAQVTLQERLSEIRRRVLQLLWLDGLSRFVTVCLSSAVLICLCDWWLRWDAAAWRISSTGIAAMTAAAAVWYCLWAPLRARLSNVELAQQIEQRFPQLGDRLSNTIAFADATFHPAVGSPGLQQRLAEQTEAATAGLDLGDAVETRHVLRNVFLAALIALGVSLLTGLHRTEAATAIGRLMRPLEHRSWPQTTELVLLDTQFEPLNLEGASSWRRSAGATMEFLVANARGGLPADARLLLKTGTGPVIQQELSPEIVSAADGSTREFARVKLQLRQGPVQFRAVGGDDRTMRWFQVHVIPQPTVEEFSLTLYAPECLGQPPVKQPAGEFAVRAVVGTRVDVAGRASRALASVRLHVRGQQPVDARLEGDGREFLAVFSIEEPGPGAYWFELIDRDGVSNHNAVQYEIDGIAERPPRVRLISPTADVSVLPQASLPVRADVSDDFGIQSVVLKYRVATAGSSPPEAGRQEPEWTTVSLHGSGAAAERQVTIDHTWELSKLSLQPGTRLMYLIAAGDACTEAEEALGKSVERSLLIVTAEEKAAELASRETLLRQSVEAALETQQQAIKRTDEVSGHLESAQRSERHVEDLLRRINQDEAQVQTRVANPVDGSGAQAARLLAELSINHLDDAAAEHRYRQVVSASSLLGDVALPAVEGHLGAARRLAEGARELQGDQQAATSKEMLESLRAAAMQQKSVVASLEAMLELLARWEREHRLATGLGELIRSQEKLNGDTADIGRRTLTSARDRLPQADRDQLAELVERQRANANAVEQWQQRLEHAAETPEAAATVAELKEQPVSGRMRQAAGHLQENEISAAAQLQQEILSRLRGLNERLHGRSPSAAPVTPAELRAEALVLEHMRHELTQLREATQHVAPSEDSPESRERMANLARRQASLRETAESSTERLRGQQAMTPASAVARAAAEMKAAEEHLQDASAGRAAARQADAERQLAIAGRELDRWLDASQDAERQAASEVVEMIAAIIERQSNVNDETRSLAREWTAAGRWNRSRLKSLADLRETQAGVASDTRRLNDRTEIGRAGRFAIEDAVDQLEAASSGLEDREVGEATQRPQRQALTMLQSLQGALQAAGDGPSKSQPGQEPANGEGADDQPDWNELRVVRAIQQQLQERTARIEQAAAAAERANTANAEDAGDVERIAARQRELYQLAREAGAPLLKPELGQNVDAPPPPADDAASILKQAQGAARSAVGAMESAAEQLADAQTGSRTQQFQRQAVDDLDQLLELADLHGSLSRQASLEPTGQPPDPRAKPLPANGPPPEETPESPAAPNSQAGNEPGNATTADTTEGAVELIRRQALVEGVWGHLPPAVREQVLNMSGDRTLPAYEDLVRRYFEELAEPGR